MKRGSSRGEDDERSQEKRARAWRRPHCEDEVVVESDQLGKVAGPWLGLS